MGLHFGISYLPGLSYLFCIKELIIMAITGFGMKIDRVVWPHCLALSDHQLNGNSNN